VIGPQRVVQSECYCIGGLGASAGGEAGWGVTSLRVACAPLPHPPFPQPLIPLAPPLGLTTCSLLLLRHAPREVLQGLRKQKPPKPKSELEPEGGTLRHEKRPGAEAEEHHRDRNALLPAHV